jgi:hypothetical protein
MAVNTFTAPRCKIRRVVAHFYPVALGFCEAVGTKGGGYPCEQQFFGRRGKPVKTMRVVAAVKAFAIAKALQGHAGCTVSVICIATHLRLHGVQRCITAKPVAAALNTEQASACAEQFNALGL